MAERPLSNSFGLMFVPEESSVTNFKMFAGPPFPDSSQMGKGVNSASHHIQKFTILAELTNRLAGRLGEDAAELEATGYTPAVRSKEYAALIESLYCELYAVLDGIRRTLYGAYPKVKGVQNESTQKLFRRASERQYGPDFPEDIRAALATAYESWFPRVCEIRTEVTHGEVGSCHLDQQTGRIFYMHGGLGERGRSLVIEDIAAKLTRHYEAVMALAEFIYRSLFVKLDPIERRVPCGVWKGRLYERDVAATRDINFHSGRCYSHVWFENQPGAECPLRDRCGAYARAVSEQPTIEVPAPNATV